MGKAVVITAPKWEMVSEPFGLAHYKSHWRAFFMATRFATENMNLIEAFNREHYVNAESLLAQLMMENDFFRTAAVLPANHGSLHRTLVADEVRSGKVRSAYEPIASLGGKTHIKDDPIVEYSGDSEVDITILESAPDPYAARASEDALCLCGFANGWNEILLKGDGASSGGFEGLMARRNSISHENVLNVGDTGSDLTSAYIVEFGENAVALRYAKGTTPGIQTRDNGLVKAAAKAADGTSDGYYWAMSQSYKISFGLSVRQERGLWRICNIDAMGTTIGDFLEQVIRAKNKMPHKGRGGFMYVNSDLLSRIEIGTINKATNLSIKEIENYGECLHFGNLPILPMDVIETGEETVA